MRKLKGFTLVEILIVIVIIGILIGALVPRMQSAQGRARDVARKNDLSQLQSAIVTSYSDKGVWPAQDGSGPNGMAVLDIALDLEAAGLNGVPSDPIRGNTVTIGNTTLTGGSYGYMTSMKNGVANAGFVLMAHTEVEGGSNRVYCSGTNTFTGGLIDVGHELRDVIPCTSMNYNRGGSDCGINHTTHTCTYNDPMELRYIMVY